MSPVLYHVDIAVLTFFRRRLWSLVLKKVIAPRKCLQLFNSSKWFGKSSNATVRKEKEGKAVLIADTTDLMLYSNLFERIIELLYF
jgi:hypothetical protein